MSDTSIPTKRKSPWVSVGLGCGALLVIALVLAAILSVFAFNMGKRYAAEQQAPGDSETSSETSSETKTDAKTDGEAEARTVTFRQVSDGKEITVSLADLEQGRFSFETGDGESVTVGAGKGGITMTQTTEEGVQTMTVGRGSSSDYPDWVTDLVPTGGELSPIMHLKSGDSESGAFSVKYSETVEEIASRLESAATEAGVTLEKSTFSTGDHMTIILQSTREDGRSFTATIQPDGEATLLAVSFEIGG